MTVWFTSDWHLFHDNILKLVPRPFKNVQQMHSVILANYRSCVREGDVVHFLGDLTLRGPSGIEAVRRLVGGLPGTKHFVLGNHDRLKVQSLLKMGFASVHSSLVLRHGSCQYLHVHDPDEDLNTGWSYAPRIICGHVHEKWRYRAEPRPAVNVGVDAWGFQPVRRHTVMTLFDNPPDSFRRMLVGNAADFAA